jgi:hypothetical protein
MVTDAWLNVWRVATEARRWMMVANSLDIISEAYELHTGIPATAMLTSEGIYLEITCEGALLEVLEPDEIAELAPEAYVLLRRAGVIEKMDAVLNQENQGERP